MTAPATHSDQRTLVLGATGRHGRTGARIVERLLGHGHQMRVMARADGHAAEELREQGVDVVIGDLLDRRTLRAAVDGMDAVYFAYPVAPGIVPAAANLASVLREAALAPHLVVMSMAAAAAESPSGLGRAQYVAEELFAWAGLKPTVLRVAALFYENILLLHGPSIRAAGGFANSFGAGRVPWISGRDAADLAVAALVDPNRFADHPITYTPGAELLNHADIASVISAEIGSRVHYTHIPQQQWQAELAGAAGPVINPDMAQHISTIGAMLANPSAALPVTPDRHRLAKLIGHEPMPFTEFVGRHRNEFQYP
ncbi:NmrA family NAD(P)-binding protein [Nocardia sp. R6R-6]|uniref:NmrA family NAD(P)-binding protein n=1 Tax=Nocardia sp. R6R-6 TaxID=3459303 RepID=UPI00403D6340